MENEPEDEEPFNPEDPELVFEIDENTTYTVGPDAVSAYTFVPPNNVYDHVYIYISRPGEKPRDIYVFEGEIGYLALRRYTDIHRCVQHLNLKKPAQRDRVIFMTRQLRELRETNFVPEEWEAE